VYWYGTPNATPSMGRIYRIPKNAVDAGAEELLSNVINPGSLTVRNGVLYMTYGGSSVLAVSLSPGLAQFRLAANESGAGNIAVDDANVYWTALGNGDIRRCAIAGCDGKPESIATKQIQPGAIAVDDKAVYWTEYNGGTVKGLAK
jgi:hypothetical protein